MLNWQSAALRALLFLLPTVLLAGCTSSPEDLAKGVVISDVKIVDAALPLNGKPCQVILCTVTNNNDVPIYRVDGQYIVELDGSGLLEPAGEKVIEYTIAGERIDAHASIVKSQDQGFVFITQPDGRCLSARVVPTKAFDRPNQ